MASQERTYKITNSATGQEAMMYVESPRAAILQAYATYELGLDDMGYLESKYGHLITLSNATTAILGHWTAKPA